MTEILPVVDFHHKDPRKKQFTWDDLKSLSFNRIIRIADKEGLEVTCANCHMTTFSSVFNAYKDQILSGDYLNVPISKKKILGYTAQIKIAEELYEGVCQDFRKIGVSQLPSLSFHHTDPKLKTIQKPSNYIRSNYANIVKIKALFLKEKITMLCKNCHRLEENIRFLEHKREILSKYLNGY